MIGGQMAQGVREGFCFFLSTSPWTPSLDFRKDITVEIAFRRYPVQ